MVEILRCSGLHWLGTAAAWTALAITVAVLSGEKRETLVPREPGRTVVLAGSLVSVATPTPRVLAKAKSGVEQSVTSFDFNAAPNEAFGDVDSADQAPLFR